MFVAKVEGRSMEPRIPAGSYCIFRGEAGGGPLAGSRQGKIVLVALHDAADPEDGGAYTVEGLPAAESDAIRRRCRPTCPARVAEPGVCSDSTDNGRRFHRGCRTSSFGRTCLTCRRGDAFDKRRLSRPSLQTYRSSHPDL